jgi:hypothetical protein
VADFKAVLIKLQQNLNILREREAKYGGNTPLELLNQIEDHQKAITLLDTIEVRLIGLPTAVAVLAACYVPKA